MSESTELYGLILPEQEDYYDISEFNYNTQTIEDELSTRLQVIYGSYVGTGTCGKSNPTIIPVGVGGTMHKLEISMTGRSFAIGSSPAVSSLILDLTDLTTDYKQISGIPVVSYGSSAHAFKTLFAKKIIANGITQSIALFSENSESAGEIGHVVQMNYYNSYNPSGFRYRYKVYYTNAG